jgi:ribosome recycling factor
MNTNDSVKQVKTKLDAAAAHFQDELKKLRTGRAHAGMLDGVMVDAYGTQLPLNQAATVTAPEAQLLQITPFDPGNLQAISAAIRNNQSLGFNPMDDGRVVRVQIPPLTTERRQQIAKQLREKQEDAMISMRAARQAGMKDLDQAKNDKLISEDEHKRLSKQIDDIMADQKAEIESLANSKETEIMTV